MGTLLRPGLSDFMLAVASLEIEGFRSVNKFGRNPEIDTTAAPADIWDAGGIWTPPTQARIHNVTSTLAADTAAGTGARTIRIWGLRTWDEDESFEDLTLNGTTPVPTANAYVIIYRMQVRSAGSGKINAGNITATAQTDATVTAQITATNGQTLMAIYGVARGYTLYVNHYYVGMNRTTGTTSSADVGGLTMRNADQPDAAYTKTRFVGLSSVGSSYISQFVNPPSSVEGPAIIKIQAKEVSANDTDISAGFDGIVRRDYL